MGTRGAMGFVVDGVEKITFSQAASGPDDLGSELLYWLHDVDIETAPQQARELKVMHPNSFPTQAMIDSLKHYANTDKGSGSLASWYVLLYGTFSDTQEILDSGYIIDDSISTRGDKQCRWAYIVDFDNKVFEIYKHSPDGANTLGRFSQGKQLLDRNGNLCYPLGLFASYPFDNLPRKIEALYP